MEIKTKWDIEDEFVKGVKEAIDLIVAGGEDEFPVMGSVLVKEGIATHTQLQVLAQEGLISFVEIDVPSILMPGKTVKDKAYYTENRVPSLVKAYIKQ